jgi:uncharacterized protein (TIGR03437 family)
MRIDGAVPSAVTVEDPQRITPGPAEIMRFGQYVAPSEILVIAGTGMGPAQKMDAQLGPDGKLATTLAGTSVTFDRIPAPLLSVQSGQIVCIVPFGARGLTMQVQSNGAVSNSILMPSDIAAVEAFAIANGDGSVNTPDHPAPPGSMVTVYAAGLGPTSPSSMDGEINGTTPRKLEFIMDATIYDTSGNSWPAEVLFAGPAPGQVAGITQINVRVPQLTAGQYTVAVGFAPLVRGQGYYDVIALNVGQP